MEKLAVQTQKVQFEYNAFTCLLNGHKKSVMVDTTSNMNTLLEFQADCKIILTYGTRGP